MAKGIITKYMGNCIVCGRPVVDVHHCCFGNGGRELSDKDGLIIPVCREHHDGIHESGVAGKLSKIVGQLAFEKRKVAEGMTEEEAREAFRKRYKESNL